MFLNQHKWTDKVEEQTIVEGSADFSRDLCLFYPDLCSRNSHLLDIIKQINELDRDCPTRLHVLTFFACPEQIKEILESNKAVKCYLTIYSLFYNSQLSNIPCFKTNIFSQENPEQDSSS